MDQLDLFQASAVGGERVARVVVSTDQQPLRFGGGRPGPGRRRGGLGEHRADPGRTTVGRVPGRALGVAAVAARRAVDEGGAYVNNVKVTDADWKPAADDLLFGKWLVLRRGKKTFAGAKIGA